MNDQNKMNILQNMHVLFWLLKDMSWCNSWHKLGIIMIVPTLILAVKIAWESRKQLAELVHNVAVCLWICANITWMTGEFFYEDGTRPYARIFFFAGLGVLGLYYAHLVLSRVGKALANIQMDTWKR